MSLFHSLLAAGGGVRFSDGVFSPSNPVVLETVDDALRDQCIFEIDSNTWGMSYAVGLTEIRAGVKYATAAKSNPHVWTKLNSPFLVQSNPVGWDKDIDSGDIIKLDDGSWVMCYTDETTGKFGIATRTAGTFGAFTKHASNPVLDNTADTGAWNQYIRHASIIKRGSTYYTFFEAREGAANGSGVIERRIGKATSTDLVNWTLDDTPVFQKADFADTIFLSRNQFWMPHVIEVNGIYYMSLLSFTEDADISNAGGFYIATSPDLETWTIMNTSYPLISVYRPCGDWDDHLIQEPSLFYENGNFHIYFNGSSASSSSSYNIGYLTLSLGTQPGIPADTFSDDFDDTTINPAKWNAQPQGGITLTEVGGRLLIQGDGSTQALVEILEGLTGYASNIPSSSMAFGYQREAIAGGDVRIGLFNSDNTTFVCFSTGTTLNTIRLRITVGGVSTFDNTVTYMGGRLKIAIEGCLVSFWEARADSEWTNITGAGVSERGTTYEETDLNATLYPKILAANATTAYVVRVDDIVVKPYNDPFFDAYCLHSFASEESGYIKYRLSSLTSQEQTALDTFVAACVDHGNWKVWNDDLWCFKFNATDAPKGWKLKTATVNGPTHGSNGYSFDGVDDWILTNLNLKTDTVSFSQNRAMVSVYLYSVGSQTGTRYLFDANDGTDIVSLFHNGTDKRVRMNKITANNRIITGTFAADKVYNAIRSGSGSSAENLYIDGVLQSATGGNAATGTVNDALEIGRSVAASNYLEGVIGFVAVGRHFDTFDQAAWNTDLRAFLSSL